MVNTLFSEFNFCQSHIYPCFSINWVLDTGLFVDAGSSEILHWPWCWARRVEKTMYLNHGLLQQTQHIKASLGIPRTQSSSWIWSKVEGKHQLLWLSGFFKSILNLISVPGLCHEERKDASTCVTALCSMSVLIHCFPCCASWILYCVFIGREQMHVTSFYCYWLQLFLGWRKTKKTPYMR